MYAIRSYYGSAFYTPALAAIEMAEAVREAGHEDHGEGHGQAARPRQGQGDGPYRDGRQGGEVV